MTRLVCKQECTRTDAHLKTCQAIAIQDCSSHSWFQRCAHPQVVAQLAVVSGKVDSLRVAQDSVTSQVAALQAKVDQANALAEARASNTRVQDLIVGEWH